MKNLICKNCGKTFLSKKSSKQHCSSECFSEWRNRPEIKAETVSRRKKACMEKYGVENAAKSADVKDRTKQTCIEKYGSVSPTGNVDVRQRQLKTCMENYGENNPGKIKKFQDKMRSTMMSKFGVQHALQSEVLKENTKRTSMKKYGVDNPAKNIDVKNKMAKTNMMRYGVPYVMDAYSIKYKSLIASRKIHFANLIVRLEGMNISPIFSEEEYIGGLYDKKYPFKCKKCGTEFTDQISSGNVPRCTTCYPINDTSLLEKEVGDFLLSIGCSDVEKHNREILGGLELDFFIPSKKIAIEVNGNYWHSEISGCKYKNYHLNKTEKCEARGIHLIHIFEDEWIFNREIIKNKLSYILSSSDIKTIYARKCSIREIDVTTSNRFLNNYHLQGSDKSSVRLGAFFGDDLVSVATFGKRRIALGGKNIEGDYELYRFCSTGRVVGILSKLISFFIKEYRPAKITTYADRRMSTKSKCGYSQCGFSFVKMTAPNYWYIHEKNSHRREYRFNYRKDQLDKKLELFDPSKTEWENMKLNGYDRIWDCGHLKYEMIIDKKTTM